MAKFTIYSKDGSKVRYEGEPQYSGSYMSVDYLEFRTISSPQLIEWERGDYVDYFRTGMRYKLYSHPMPKKVARRGEYGGAIEYSNVQFFGATKELEIAPFRDLVPEDNTIHFSTRPDVSTYENVYGIARRIQECINDIFPNRWRIEVYDTDDADLRNLLNETKEYSVSDGSCLDALSQIYETWKNVGWIHSYDSANDIDVITIGRANVRDADNTSDSFRYGIGNGLTSIKKAAANEGEFATRLYVYGSERNIQTRYYNQFEIVNKDSVDIRNLMLPIETWGKTNGLPDARKAYLQADDSIIEKYGLIPRTVYFDGNGNEDIYPSITGLTMKEVRQAMIDEGQSGSEYLPGDHDHRIDKVYVEFSSDYDGGSKEETEKARNFRLGLCQMGINLVEQGRLTSEGFATISMKSGACAGREFKVKKLLNATVDSDGTEYHIYELEKSWDESLGMGFPNNIYPISEGDIFVLLDIPMPNFYIALAEDRMYEAGKKLLADYTRVSAFYEPGINAIKVKEGGKLLRAGMYMQVYDEDIIDTENNTDYVLIDTLTIDEKSALPIYKVTLREQKRSARTYSALEDMIDDAKEVARQDLKRERSYTDRRFRDTQETLSLLEGAFENFSKGISPVTVQTMALLVGDQSLQFKFTESRNSLKDIPCPIVYREETKQMFCAPASMIHMTLDIDNIQPASTRTASDYKSWDVSETYSGTLEDGEPRYIYLRAPMAEGKAEMVVSLTTIGMHSESGYYHFLVGILNSEYEGTRSFVTLYGFTEVLPGQITTDVIRSSDGKTYFDLVRGIINGSITFTNSNGESKDMADFADEQDSKFNNIGKTIEKVQDQIDGVVENWNGNGPALLTTEPAKSWIAKGDAEMIAHINDTYINIEEYVDDETTPTSGHAWRWCECTDTTITDYVTVTDNEGNTFNLHWHKIANSDAVRALKEAAEASKKVSDMEYLGNTFKDGSTEIQGGVVMSEMVAVKNEEGYIEAFLNGSQKIEDSSHGKLILAGGIPAGAEELSERAKRATTRIYEDGSTHTKDMHLQEGCTVGSSIRVTEDGIELDNSNIDGKLRVSEKDGIVIESEEKIARIGGECNNTMIDIRAGEYKKTCPYDAIHDAGIGVHVDIPNGVAFMATSGVFAGLRPYIRMVATNPIVEKTVYLREIDNTIFVDGEGTALLELPNDPPVGQVYDIYKTMSASDNNRVVISSSTLGIHIPQYDAWDYKSFSYMFKGIVRLICVQYEDGSKGWWFYRLLDY